MLAWRPALADGRDVFTVANVPVDATAANANAARDQARGDGERRAYAMLLDRITLDSDRARRPAANDTVLNDLISSFEVAGERTSGVRYLAKYTFHFRPDAVRKLLRQAALPFCETPSKPLVVLALVGDGDGAQLWEDPNPWRNSWSAHPPPAGLVPLVMPYGDLEDVQAIDAASALAGDPARLQAVSQRYGGADVLVTAASLDAAAAPHALAVKSTRFSPGSDLPPQSWTKSYTATADQSDGDLYAAAIAGTAQQVEQAWKEANILDYSRAATIIVSVPVGELQRYVEVRDRLAQLPGIERSELLSLDRQQARLAIHYFGTPDQLRTALAQRDLSLGGQDPDWVLERRAASPRLERHRVSVANLVTLARLLSVPLAIWLVLDDRMTFAFWLFVAAGLSDAVDGFIAKRFDQRSRLGALLDPVADKVLLMSMFVTLGIADRLPDWLVILVVFRDVLIIGGFLLAASVAHPIATKPLAVSKLNTALQIALVAVVLGRLGLGLPDFGAVAVLSYAVALTTVLSGGGYLVRWMRGSAGERA